MKTLYFDCFAGASGNMILGALVGLGVDKKELVDNLKMLDVADFAIEFSIRDKSGIAAVHADVKIPPEHAHRHLSAIVKIIDDSRLKDSVKRRAIEIFTKLAQAEAKIHGIDIEKVHFHEVGAMDAIIDVVGACIGFEMLGIDRFVCSKIHTGSGFAQMAHGKFPIPPPAVAELLQNAPVYQTEIVGELITPTGAAIIATLCEEFGSLPEMKIEKTAYGAGTREYKNFPNALRLILGNQDQIPNSRFQIPNSGEQIPNSRFQIPNLRDQKADANSSFGETNLESGIWNLESHRSLESGIKSEFVVLLETNIDDMTAENLGFLMERSFALGCLDCWFTPIQMKKNRPATLVAILCAPESEAVFKELLFTETSTLGLRVSHVKRESLPRENRKIRTESGEIDVKIAKFGGRTIKFKPEYEQMREIAVKSKLSFSEIERLILEELKKSL